MRDSVRAFLEDVLNLVEEREAGLLVWGIVDGFFAAAELRAIVDPLIDAAHEKGHCDFFDANGVIAALVDCKWLVEVEGSGGETAYRSRMAETMRLLLRLRQLFPKHSRTEFGWQEAPVLVADFRFQRRRRLYPRRGVGLDSVLSDLRRATENPIILRGVEALINSSQALRESGLAQFQVRAAERILRAIESDKALATIVCAGTASGKTLAFYLPALASILRHRLSDPAGQSWVKVVAIYPRSELLKDQLAEVLRRLFALKDHLHADPKPTITVGALYGDTPRNAQYCDWPVAGTDRICPTLRCPKCNGELRWAADDYRRAQERLICRNADCGFSVDGTIFPLTRESLAKQPPDILFSTTEMLNQRLADNNLGHLFGVGTRAPRPPELVLLDEVHTYEGRHGAQVAYLMRRWQRLVQQSLRFVGLSATLREAPSFFSALTGAWLSSVEEISPKGDQLLSEGAEYLVALRGDPVSRTALLSTTIQSAMLMERCLDPRTSDLRNTLSDWVFGQRTFVFTDNLDVTNRLYFNLLDAEGRDSFGRPNMRLSPNGGLAQLRRTGLSRLRYYGGQDWRMCESLGHQLSTRLNVERVSSQDTGVDAGADIVVATAALEVGFDDPTVGAVIQHKAPRGMAGYLQRKGRAGRIRGMRPWMVTVLSDYGRDRLAYQNYDLLFDPELPVRTLPLSNRYITRMQAVYASIDYLGERLQDAPRGSVWRDLSSPPANDVRTARLVKELRSILETEQGTRRLADHLRLALKLSDEEVSALLWEYPRPLMTTALPTALRRLTSRWRARGERNHDFQIRNNPLPEFIPASLFADLNLAEVRIELPNVGHGHNGEAVAMPLFAALREFAPGRISRRFGIRHRGERFWVPPPDDALINVASGELSVDQVGNMLKVGEYFLIENGKTETIPVYRPLSIRPQTPPANISDTSNARLIWHTQIVPLGIPDWLFPPTESTWNTIVRRIGFFLHASNVPVEVRRFATGSSAEVGVGKGDRRRIGVNFAMEGRAAAIGAAFTADGVVFQIALPERLYARDADNAAKWRALRTGRFMDDAWRGVALGRVPNPFLREWLAQIQLSAITYDAVKRQVSLEVAAAAVANGTATIGLIEVLDVLFQSQVIDVEDEELQLGGQDRLRQELEGLLHDEGVLEDLREAASRLWEPLTEEWEPWLRLAYRGTLACALLRALCDLCPTIDPDDLVVDLQRGPIGKEDRAPLEPGLVEIWITEQGPGGNGLIEEFMHRYAEDPRRFFSMVRAALEMGEFELIDHQITRLLEVLTDESESSTRSIIASMRSAATHAELNQLSKQLRVAMVREGFSPFHGFIVSMANRVLRPGAGPATDRYLASAIARWKTEEQRLGIEIDLRVLCYWLSQNSDIDSVIAEVGIPQGSDAGAWRMSAVYGLLWARGRAIREAPLQTRSPFAELPQIERLLVIDTISDERVLVSVEDPNWLTRVATLLAEGHSVTLTCGGHGRVQLSQALNALICNPIEAGYLRAYARLQSVRQAAGMMQADVELAEAAQ